MPHATARITHITVVTRDDVDVQVADCLPCCRTGIEADVIAVGLELGVELVLNRIDESQHVGPLLVSGLPPGSDYPSRHHQGMPWANREMISDDERRTV